MHNFRKFVVEKELKEYAFDENDFYTLEESMLNEARQRAPGTEPYPHIKQNRYEDHPFNRLTDAELYKVHRNAGEVYSKNIDPVYDIQSRTPKTDEAEKDMNIADHIMIWRKKLKWKQEVSDWNAGAEQRKLNRIPKAKRPVINEAEKIPVKQVDAKESGGNIWQKVRKGASDYFDASPEEREKIYKEAKTMRHAALFTDEAANPKLAKNGEKLPEYKTKGLFLAPSTMSGVDVCPAASKECAAACLGTSSGRAHMAPVKKARVDKTKLLFESPKHFYALLDQEIHSAKKSAKKNGQTLAVRLNGTSDIPHEHLAPQLFKEHSDVQFYDYTKIPGRTKHKEMPENYHLTVSSTGLNHEDSNWSKVKDHLDNGGTAAMVFRVPTGIKGRREAGELPSHVKDEATGKQYRVIDGDEHDHRHLDKKINGIPDNEGVIAGLRVKGGPNTARKAGKFAVEVQEENGEKFAVAEKGKN